MNITFFNDVRVLGGGELWVLRMAHALSARGHQISIVCPDQSALFHICLEEGVDVYGFANQRGIPFHEPLYRFLRSRETDIVYCTVIGGFCEAQTLSRSIRRLNEERQDSKSILILKTGLPPMTGLGGEYYGFGAGPEIRRLHVVSEKNKNRFVEWQGCSEAAFSFIEVLREGVDLSHFRRNRLDRDKIRAKWQIDATQLLVTNTSRLHPAKGQDKLLLAARDLIRQRSNMRFFFAGAGNYLSHLEELRDRLELQDYVSFIGHIKDVKPLLVATDIFCHPSLEDGLPNSVAEAMAMALPAIASNVGGVPEIIKHEKNGLLVPAGDVGELMKGILRIADDPSLRVQLGDQAAKDIQENFDFHKQVSHWEKAVAEELVQFQKRNRKVVSPPVFKPLIANPVLFLMTHLRTGGEESEVAILARHLDRTRFPLSVASGWAVDEPSPAVEKLRALDIPVDTSCHRLPTLQEKVDYLVNKIRQEQIQLVVACQSTRLAYEVMGWLHSDECRLIEHAGTVDEVRKIPKDRTAMHIGVSLEIAREAARLMPDSTKARFLPSMVDTEEFNIGNRKLLRSTFGFESKLVVLFVGRLDAKKGVHHLIDAATKLSPEFSNLVFLIVGPPDAYKKEYAQTILDRAKREAPDGHLLFTGGRDDVPQLMRASDVFVLPSIGEGMSHVINEAGVTGLPVIAFDNGAAREQLSGGAAGVLVAAGDTSGFVEALRLLLRDPTERSRLGGALKEHVLRHYSAEVIVPRWQAVLEEVSVGLAPVAHVPAVRPLHEDSLLPFPLEIQIETNTACNATCIMCPHKVVSKELPVGHMSLEMYEKILAECAKEETLKRIEPFLNNEPFTDLRIVDWISLAKRTVPNAVVTITTNGSLLTPKVSDRLISSGLDAIWFSFNGTTKKTYEKIMGLSFDTVKRNIDYLLSIKPNNLRVFTNMIDTAPMRGEIAKNIRYWQSRGVQSGASPLMNRAGNVSNFDELNYKTLSQLPVRTCDLLFYKMYIGYNGDVLLCCMDWRRRIVLGNVGHQSLREIWHGKRYQHYRRLQEEGRSNELELCQSCTYLYS